MKKYSLENIKLYIKDNSDAINSILIGTAVGILSLYICMRFNLEIFGFNLFIIISPLIAGFTETFVALRLCKRSTGAISAIILFILTNIIGWFFPETPIQWNLLTFGGLGLMIQAAFPIAINYLIYGIILGLTYILGLFGKCLGDNIFKITNNEIIYEKKHPYQDFQILMFTNCPDIPIKEYKSFVVDEIILNFDDKNSKEKLDYLGSKFNERKTVQELDYMIIESYVLESIEEKAINCGANAIIDIQLEYIPLNDRLNPDVMVAASGTAVVL
ncbi:MAG: heavy metal-binding domain-containing protein [Methanobacteriaceae archaeon]|nr:heavy metal-binding domain-containing protein [Methanobacteriaceae archaeon]